jgi:hypothetical protein
MNVWAKHMKEKALALLVGMTACLLALSACAPYQPTPSPFVHPSEVTTRDGVIFNVKDLRIPGTRQELRLKEGGTLTWIPLEQVAAVHFTGPTHDLYRQATIILTGGEILQGEVFVDFLIEGTTDLGYWNMPMSKVERLKLGYDW